MQLWMRAHLTETLCSPFSLNWIRTPPSVAITDPCHLTIQLITCVDLSMRYISLKILSPHVLCYHWTLKKPSIDSNGTISSSFWKLLVSALTILKWVRYFNLILQLGSFQATTFPPPSQYQETPVRAALSCSSFVRSLPRASCADN